jgi:CelD/BcsL family acetyltransferase involved in cellulose biosynthesis
VTIEIIDNFAHLAGIQSEWSSFARTIDGVTPFQLPEWLLGWWRHFGQGQLYVVVFRERNAIAGIIPCFRHQWNGRRQLTLIGSGISDYLEPPIQKEYSSAALEMLQNQLSEDLNWDVCNWQDLSADTPLRRLAGFDLQICGDTECSEIPLNGSFNTYWQTRPKSLRQNVRRDKQKAESAGQLEFEAHCDSDPELIDALIQLHTTRWQKRGEPGMVEANGSAEFLRDTTRKFASRDMLRMFGLRFARKIGAVILAFHYRGALFNYLTAFDPDLETFGLGRTLLLETMHHVYESGYTAWNFLRGNEPYKYWWGAQRIPKCRLIITRTA